MHKLIVYGTLLRNEHNHFMMEGAEFLGEVIIPNAVIHDLGGCPGLKFLPPNNYSQQVAGELYNVNDILRERLDHFEGHPVMYERVECEYLGSKDEGVWLDNAWVYEYRGDCYEPPIPSGDWRLRHTLP